MGTIIYKMSSVSLEIRTQDSKVFIKVTDQGRRGPFQRRLYKPMPPQSLLFHRARWHIYLLCIVYGVGAFWKYPFFTLKFLVNMQWSEEPSPGGEQIIIQVYKKDFAGAEFTTGCKPVIGFKYKEDFAKLPGKTHVLKEQDLTVGMMSCMQPP